ncbi:hypothetical protein K466DRAFT_391128 [Polyporus arcularius HHB13444]|uniref:Uncharacterized protein n=1 Tax=Polyporus arcularius HHB13444 TaxID=1314778 RepID=A0A5C3NS83_9APHY|nr:hypothetical protein K466DRAFT_391128 [Polyporus arcularius HHB13444]
MGGRAWGPRVQPAGGLLIGSRGEPSCLRIDRLPRPLEVMVRHLASRARAWLRKSVCLSSVGVLVPCRHGPPPLYLPSPAPPERSKPDQLWRDGWSTRRQSFRVALGRVCISSRSSLCQRISASPAVGPALDCRASVPVVRSFPQVSRQRSDRGQHAELIDSWYSTQIELPTPRTDAVATRRSVVLGAVLPSTPGPTELGLWALGFGLRAAQRIEGLARFGKLAGRASREVLGLKFQRATLCQRERTIPSQLVPLRTGVGRRGHPRPGLPADGSPRISRALFRHDVTLVFCSWTATVCSCADSEAHQRTTSRQFGILPDELY